MLTAVKLVIKQVVVAFNHWFRLIIIFLKKLKFMRGIKGRKCLGRHG